MKKMKQLNKKGQVMQNLGALAVGVAALVIILAITFLVMGQTKSASIPLITATTFTNVTKTMTNDTFVLYPECIHDEALAIVGMMNGTGVESVGLDTGNYTVVLNTVNASVSGAISTTAAKNVTYSCRTFSNAYNATEDLQNATATIPGWIPLIILVIIGGVILGLVSAFKRR